MDKNYLIKFKRILDKGEKSSQIKMTSGNYDNKGNLIKEKTPTLTTEFCEIGLYRDSLYFVFIILSKTFSRKFFNLLRDFSNIQIYGFKDFKTNLYSKPDFDYKEFEENIKKDKFLQIEFDFNPCLISPKELYLGYLKLKGLFEDNKVKIVNQIYVGR